MRIIKILLILITASTSFAHAGNVDIEKELSTLDSVLAQKDKYIQEKQKTIDGLKREYTHCNTLVDQYSYNKRLYDEYMKFDSDSALTYAYRCKKTAWKAGLEMEKLSSQIDIIYITVLQGEFFKGRELLNNFGNIDSIPEILRPKLALVYLELILRQMMRDRSAMSNKKPTKEIINEYNKYNKYLPINGWQYCYYKAVISGSCKKEEIVRHLRDTRAPSVQTAMLYIALAHLFINEGNQEMFCHNLIQSAINDIMSANRESSSTIQLIYTPYIEKGSKRASKYVALCMENANHYGDRYRSLDIMNANTFIAKGYEERLEKNGQIMQVVIIMLILSMIVTVVALRNMVNKKKRLSAVGIQLKDANESLLSEMQKIEAMQQEIAETNRELTDEIENRNRSFINIYRLLSQYITDMTTFKKTVFNLITAGKVDKARKELGSNAEMEKYLKGFYRHFDKAFLVTHPDFMDKFNAILRPECRIILPEEATLTPELRIYALVSIGITDSVSIAQFLHYSTQTIYNYRLKMRHNACIPESAFADTVYRFYNKDEDKERDGEDKKPLRDR